MVVDMIDMIKERIASSIDVKQEILRNEYFLLRIKQAVEMITTCFKGRNKVFFCGNGGSAADAQHLAAEFSGRFYFDRAPLPAEALHCNTSFVTAISNDYNFDIIYSRLIAGFAKKGDVLVGLSTSGNAKNVVQSFEKAKEMGVNTIGFTGESGGLMKDLSDILLNVPSNNTPRIQESHILIGHIICEFVEQAIFG